MHQQTDSIDHALELIAKRSRLVVPEIKEVELEVKEETPEVKETGPEVKKTPPRPRKPGFDPDDLVFDDFNLALVSAMICFIVNLAIMEYAGESRALRIVFPLVFCSVFFVLQLILYVSFMGSGTRIKYQERETKFAAVVRGIVMGLVLAGVLLIEARI